MANATASFQSDTIDKFLELLDERLDACFSNDLTPNIVDAASEQVLYFLAHQFDLLGVNGWRFANGDLALKRSLLREAIELHRRKGTPFSIKDALQRIGFKSVIISEGVSALYNGQISYNGMTTYGSLNWAHFSVVIQLGQHIGVSAAVIQDMVDIIEEYKAARSLLIGITYAGAIDEIATPTEDLTFGLNTEDSEAISYGLLYNGVMLYDGSMNYGDSDPGPKVSLNFGNLADSFSTSESIACHLQFADGSTHTIL